MEEGLGLSKSTMRRVLARLLIRASKLERPWHGVVDGRHHLDFPRSDVTLIFHPDGIVEIDGKNRRQCHVTIDDAVKAAYEELRG